MGLPLSKRRDEASPLAPPSWMFFDLALLVRGWCLSLADRLATPLPLLAYEMANGAMKTQIFNAVKRIGIVDALGKSSAKSAAELAKELDLNQDAAYRLLRAAANLGLLHVERGPRGVSPRFRNSPLSTLLRDDHPRSVWPMVKWTIEDGYGTFQELGWVVQTGGNAYRKTHEGKSLWELLKDDPKREHDFSLAMVSTEDMFGSQAVVLDYNWKPFKRLCDIGGCLGSLLAQLMRQYPRAEGLLFDQPQVIARARKQWSTEPDMESLRGRVSFADGDFFSSETLPKPRAGDAWLLRYILHDWSDGDAARILAALRAAMGTTKVTLCIVETTFLDEFQGDPYSLAKSYADLQTLMLLANGGQRTRAQWEKLFAGAGFKLTRIARTRGPLCVVEALPV